jgi:uncharacterized protein
MKEKQIPLRKCTGCLQMKDKKELIRIVRSNEGDFLLDMNNKKSGRGSYICKVVECFEKANKSNGLERSFKQAVPKDIYLSLKKELENIHG